MHFEFFLQFLTLLCGFQHVKVYFLFEVEAWRSSLLDKEGSEDEVGENWQ